MISAPGMAIVALTVMLWILWSDTIRSRRPTPILYTIRVFVFLGVAAALIYNMREYPWLYTRGSQALTIAAALVGVAGAAYFGRKLARRT